MAKHKICFVQADEKGTVYGHWESYLDVASLKTYLDAMIIKHGGVAALKTFLEKGKVLVEDEDHHQLSISSTVEEWPWWQRLPSFWAEYPGSQEDYIKAILRSE